MPWEEAEAVNLRQEFVLKALGRAVEFSVLCTEYGISRKTGYKWVARFKELGLGGLRDRTRRPHRSPAALREDMICELVRIKRAAPRFWGPKKVLAVYRRQHGPAEAPSLSSVHRVLDKMGFICRRRRLRQSEPARVQEGLVPQKPNALWTVDFKGWWRTRDRARCEPLTVRDGFSRFLLDLRAMASTSERAEKGKGSVRKGKG